jgi:RNA polymerase sigma-70 factor (ECF subfamily)
VTDERFLIEEAKAGNTQAFRDLIELVRLNVYRLAYDLTGNRHDAEDLSQDVFVKAYLALCTFRGDAKWSTWIYRITVNACMDHHKKNRRSRTEFDEENVVHDCSIHQLEDAAKPDQRAEAAIIRSHVDRALGCLTLQERSVFVLRHYHDLPLKQIAETMEIAEGTVKSYLSRAIQRLQRELSFYKKEFGLENQL